MPCVIFVIISSNIRNLNTKCVSMFCTNNSKIGLVEYLEALKLHNSTTWCRTYSKTCFASRLSTGSLLLTPRMSPYSRT